MAGFGVLLFKKRAKKMKLVFMITLLSCQESEHGVINRINAVNGDDLDMSAFDGQRATVFLIRH